LKRESHLSDNDIARLLDGGGRGPGDDAAWKHLRSCGRCFDIYRDSAIYIKLREADGRRIEPIERLGAVERGTAAASGPGGERRLLRKSTGPWVVRHPIRAAGAFAGIAAAVVLAAWTLVSMRGPRGFADATALSIARRAVERSTIEGLYVYPGTENAPAAAVVAHRSGGAAADSLGAALDRLFAKYRDGKASMDEIYWLAAGSAAAGRLDLARDIVAASRSTSGYECRFAILDAIAEALSGRPARAERSLSRFVSDCPDGSAAVNLAALYVEQGRLDEARAVLATIPPAPPETALHARIALLLDEARER
jgi:hypothetical protein